MRVLLCSRLSAEDWESIGGIGHGDLETSDCESG